MSAVAVNEPLMMVLPMGLRCAPHGVDECAAIEYVNCIVPTPVAPIVVPGCRVPLRTRHRGPWVALLLCRLTRERTRCYCFRRLA